VFAHQALDREVHFTGVIAVALGAEHTRRRCFPERAHGEVDGARGHVEELVVRAI